MCLCGTHSLQIEYDDEGYSSNGEFNVAIWKYGRGSEKLTLKEKIRWMWRILRTGNPWADSVVLTKKDANKLSEFLSAYSKK